jgi:hypothetical protein
MADLSKLKRRSTLGAPPPPAEASSNLEAAEIAVPAPPTMQPAAERIAAAIPSSAGQGRRIRDGRSARRTGRTVQFATRVTPEFDEQFRAIAERDRLLHVELLEKSLSAYESSRHLGDG